MYVRDVSIAGVDSASVFEVLRRRLDSRSREDGHRLGLVVEGGAMRGAYTAGSLLGLHASGASALFDDVYATSAGAVNAAYFLSGAGHLGADTYYRVLCDGRFLDWRRPWKLVDIDFLIDEVFTRLRPMEAAAVLASPSRFWIAMADFVSARSLVLCAQNAGYPLFDLLKASVAVPVGYNRLVDVGDLRAFDAGLTNPFPLREAIADGCSHILVLLSRPESHVASPSNFFRRLLFDACFARGNSLVSRSLVDAWKVKSELRTLALGQRVDSPGPSIATISPMNDRVRDTTQDAQTLREELIKCARGTVKVVERGEMQLEAWIDSGQI